MTTKPIPQVFAERISELAGALQIADQLAGMTTRQQLTEIRRRFTLVKRVDGVALCGKLLAFADKYGVA